MTIYTIDGHDLAALLNDIKNREEKRTDWDRRITSLRIEPRRHGVSVKINEGMWSPTIGRAEDIETSEEHQERNNAALRAIVAAGSQARIEQANRTGKFLPAFSDDERPAMEVAGVLAFLYIDPETGKVRVSIDVDNAEDWLITPPETVPLTVTVGDTVVFEG